MKICIIPARGGSKRILKKNIKLFHGKEIIYYSINCALESKLFDKIIVSTDDLEIAEIAKKFGAEVPFIRPKNISDDKTDTIPVIKHAINFLTKEGLNIQDICCIYATAPFVNKDDLIKSYDIFKTQKWDFVFPATEFHYPIFRSFEKKDNDSIKMFYPKHYHSRSQDLKKAYHDAGQFYWGKLDAWKHESKIFSSKSTFLNIPNWRVNDIDTLEDWKRAEILFKILKKTD
tara:strand:- start:239 stop:931 length:693 start_codon:yes stop_codon:yes gene_type:complete